MLTYSEIIGLNQNYCPYYDLLHERKDYWKSFIPTPQFYRLLDDTLTSLEGKDLSLWLQGAYGTGKSHATGFLKHLLYLPLNDIEPIIDHFSDVQLKNRLKQFRQANRIFPVIMSGAEKITNHIDFALQIEVGVRKAFEAAGIQLKTPTDFDKYVAAIETERSNYWETLIEDELEIKEQVTDKDQLIKKLKSMDLDVFIAVRDALNRRKQPIFVGDLVTWLKEAMNQLRESQQATQMMIYWDEFTTILDKNSSDIHDEILRIAQASSISGTHLYLISHRTVIQGTAKEDRNKLLGRFIGVNYEMSDITTYRLMSHAIQKIDNESWEELRNQQNKKIAKVIEMIGQNEDWESLEDIRSLYPIHPYTANISSYIARVMGSTERSIFNFLNDPQHGFHYFIHNYPGKEKIEYLTLDYIFDFFQEVFEEQNDPFFNSVMQKLLYHETELKKADKHYPPLLKVLLIINIAHHKINLGADNNRIVIPNEENLKLALMGTHLEEKIPEFLQFIDSKKIIIKDPNSRYIVDAANYDQGEIVEWINRNRGKFKNIDDVLTSEYQETLFSPLKTSHRRQEATRVLLIDASYPPHMVKQRVGKELKNDYNLNFVLFVARNLDDYSRIQDQIKDIILDQEERICYLVMDQLFTDDDLERYLEFKSRAEVAHNKHNDEAEAVARKNTEGHLNKWVTAAVKHGIVTWFALDRESQQICKKCGYADFHNPINKEISQLVFHGSFDTLYPKLKVETAWKGQMNTITATNFLTCSTYNELSQKAKGPMSIALEILADKNGSLLVNDKLKLVTSNPEHPLINMGQKLDNRFHGKDEVNLVEVCDFLFRPPYGFYANHVFMAALGFLFRKYRGKMYSVKTGELLSDLNMIEMIKNVVNYFCQNRFPLKSEVNVRIGSENEIRLVKLLEEMFELNDCNSIVDTRLKLAEWLKENLGMPLWLLKYSAAADEDIMIGIELITAKILDLRASDARISSTEFKNLYDDILGVKAKLMTMLKNIDDSKRIALFSSFIANESKNISSKYNDGYYKNLMVFLSKNLQLDPIYWDEEKVLATIKDWFIETFTNPEPPQGASEPEEFKGGNISPENPRVDRAEVMSKINSYQGNWKSLLRKLAEHDEKLASLIYELISGEDNA